MSIRPSHASFSRLPPNFVFLNRTRSQSTLTSPTPHLLGALTSASPHNKIPVTRSDAGDYVRHYFRPELAIPGLKPSLNIVDLGAIHGENLHEAYTFQDFTLAELEATGDKLLGWRVQGNSEATRRKLHYRELYCGPLLRSMTRNYHEPTEGTKQANETKSTNETTVPDDSTPILKTSENEHKNTEKTSAEPAASKSLTPTQTLKCSLPNTAECRPSVSRHGLLDAELHVAFRIYDPVIPSLLAPGEINEYLGVMYPVLELTACRYPLRPTNVPAHVADMAGAGFVFFGDPIPSEKWAGLELSELKAVLLHNNIPVAIGKSSAVVGTVMSAIKFIARHLKSRPRPLQENQVVLCGSMGCTQVKPGHITAHYGPLGCVEALVDE